jgi:hypothetical protein
VALCCRLSSAVGTQIRPLQYVLADSGFSSHARYFSPVGEGWLSAAGDYVVRDGKTVEILFDSFWADAGRDNLQPDPKGKVPVHKIFSSQQVICMYSLHLQCSCSYLAFAFALCSPCS